MRDALKLLAAKRNSRGHWIRETAWPTTTFSAYARVGTEDKWPTLKALLVLKSIKKTDAKR